jgi:hypothetical protein
VRRLGAKDGQVEQGLIREGFQNAEAFRRADWELNLGFRPGATKQEWALWPHKDGQIVTSGVPEGEGDPAEIARDVCTIMTRSGAKILN